MFKWLTDLFYRWGNGPTRTENALRHETTIWLIVLGVIVLMAVVACGMYKKVVTKKEQKRKEKYIKDLERQKIEYETKEKNRIIEEQKEREYQLMLSTQTKLLECLAAFGNKANENEKTE